MFTGDDSYAAPLLPSEDKFAVSRKPQRVQNQSRSHMGTVSQVAWDFQSGVCDLRLPWHPCLTSAACPWPVVLVRARQYSGALPAAAELWVCAPEQVMEGPGVCAVLSWLAVAEHCHGPVLMWCLWAEAQGHVLSFCVLRSPEARERGPDLPPVEALQHR